MRERERERERESCMFGWIVLFVSKVIKPCGRHNRETEETLRERERERKTFFLPRNVAICFWGKIFPKVPFTMSLGD
jgi:hypothetical protein